MCLFQVGRYWFKQLYKEINKLQQPHLDYNTYVDVPVAIFSLTQVQLRQ